MVVVVDPPSIIIVDVDPPSLLFWFDPELLELSEVEPETPDPVELVDEVVASFEEDYEEELELELELEVEVELVEVEVEEV